MKTTALSSLLVTTSVSVCSSFVVVPQTLKTANTAITTLQSSSDTVDSNIVEDLAGLDRRQMLMGVGGVLSSALIGFGSSDGNGYSFVNPAMAAEAPAKEFPLWTLANDVKMPILALNTVGLSVEDTARACEISAQNGFRHFDFHPGKERDGVAKFMKQNANQYPRKDLFLTTKIRKPAVGTTPEEAAGLAQSQLDEDLAALGTDYVDMLMIRDSPDCAVMQAQWKVAETALAQGKTRSVGVINYCEESLRCLLKTAKVKPAVNYYYYHVGMNTGRGYKLRDFLDRNKIKSFAYGALGEPEPYRDDRILESSILKNIGDGSKVYNQRNHGPGDKTTEEIAIKWVLDNGCACSVRPTTNFSLGKGVCAPRTSGQTESECEAGIRTRARVFDWELTGEERNKLDKIPFLKSDDNPTLFSSAGCPGERPIP